MLVTLLLCQGKLGAGAVSPGAEKYEQVLQRHAISHVLLAKSDPRKQSAPLQMHYKSLEDGLNSDVHARKRTPPG